MNISPSTLVENQKTVVRVYYILKQRFISSVKSYKNLNKSTSIKTMVSTFLKILCISLLSVLRQDDAKLDISYISESRISKKTNITTNIDIYRL